jgi:putative flavoprotein involved in K+ transport
LDVPSLVLEQNPRIGDNWRNRYEALCLHDPVCEYGHLVGDREWNALI